jgi:hypothetical protein
VSASSAVGFWATIHLASKRLSVDKES